MIYAFLATGFEEVEAIAPIDVLRRAGLSVKTVSITDQLTVTGAHGIDVVADSLFADNDYTDAELLATIRALEDQRLTCGVLGLVEGDILVTFGASYTFHNQLYLYTQASASSL